MVEFYQAWVLFQNSRGNNYNTAKLYTGKSGGKYVIFMNVLAQKMKNNKIVVHVALYLSKLYCGIDSNLKEKGSRPDNIYRFVETIISSQRFSEELLVYDTQPIRSMSLKMTKFSEQLEILNTECTEVRGKFENTRSQLKSSKIALQDITNQNTLLNRKWKKAKEKISQLKCKNALLEEECANFQVELLSDTDSADSDHDSPDDSVMEPSLQSIIGNSQKYSPEIRKLYYNLLAEQVPVSKITDII